MAKAWIGISGWTFPGWRGSFYPDDLPQRRELEFASRKLNSIEINGTFYSLQKPATFRNWYDQTPDGFLFSVKAPQFITHVLRLKESAEPLANFFASGLLCLKEKLGPILWQFPPNVMLKDNRFEKFLKLLPHDSKAAERLARKHGPKVKGRAWTEAEGDFPVRHAFEFRHKSFLNEDFLGSLRAHNVAFVLAHEGKRCPYTEDLTADFVYARLHGEGKPYAKGYPDKEIARWAEKIDAWNRGKKSKDPILFGSAKSVKAKRDVFVYFSNEAKVYSPNGALKLLKKLGLEQPLATKAKAA